MSRRVLVIGGGIVGLTLAGSLSRSGIDVLLCERSRRIHTQGAGITLWPNALEIFQHLGVGDEVVAAGRPWGKNVRAVAADGSSRLYDAGTVHVEDKFGWPVLLIYRYTLNEILSRTLPVGALRFSAEFVSLEEDDSGVTAHFADGTEERADVVIGADGIWSAVRRWVDPTAEPEFTDQVMWRGMVVDPAVDESVVATAGAVRTAFFPVGGGLVYWVIGKYGLHRGDNPGDAGAEALAVVAEWQEIAAMVARTPSDGVIRSEIFRMASLGQWCSRRVALAGDAAHAESPHIMVGACLGVEDAYVLAKRLSRDPDPATALWEYSRERVARLTWVQGEASRIAALPSELHAGELGPMRDELMRTAPLVARVAERSTAPPKSPPDADWIGTP